MVAIMTVLLFTQTACARGIDQAQFEGVYRAGQGMKGATVVGVTLIKYRELLQSFASEVAMAQDKAKTDREKAMVGSYTEALANYRDAATLWASKIERGSDTIDEAVLPGGAGFTAKYTVQTATPVPEHPEYRTVSADAAMQAVWWKAGQNIDLANAQYTGKAQ